MNRKKILLFLLLEMWHVEMMIVCTILIHILRKRTNRRLMMRREGSFYYLSMSETRMRFLKNILENNVMCVNEFRMDVRAFGILCELLRTHGLKNDGSVTVDEQVCIFLHILAHHVKNRTIRNRFLRSGETISRYFNLVLQAVLRLHGILLKFPEPVSEDSIDPRWRYFKVC
ncbi:hypothetical protein ACOSQ4_024513 [Xanthoceras sorbifolium]